MRHFPLSAAIRHLRHLEARLPSYGSEQRARLQTFVSGKARLKIAMRIPHIFRITLHVTCNNTHPATPVDSFQEKRLEGGTYS